MPSKPIPLSDAVQQLVDRERAKSRAARRARIRQRIETIRNHLGPIAHGLVWLQTLLPITLLVAFVLPEAALSWLSRIDFVFDILLMVSMFCAPLVTLLAPASRLTPEAKGRLIIATWVIGIGLPFPLRSTIM